jgi:hypothetical protein
VLLGVGFAFSFNHPGWAKGNFLVCCNYCQNIDLGEKISPAFIKFAADGRYIPNPEGEVKFQGGWAWELKKDRKGGHAGRERSIN